jgi:hypothetical protein
MWNLEVQCILHPVLIAFHLVGCEDWHDNMTGLHFAITVPSQFRHTVITQKGFFFICAQPTGRHYDSCTKRTWWSGMWCRWTTAHRFNRWQDWLLLKQKTRRGGGDDDNFFSLCERRKFVALGGISFDSGDHFPKWKLNVFLAHQKWAIIVCIHPNALH